MEYEFSFYFWGIFTLFKPVLFNTACFSNYLKPMLYKTNNILRYFYFCQI